MSDRQQKQKSKYLEQDEISDEISDELQSFYSLKPNFPQNPTITRETEESRNREHFFEKLPVLSQTVTTDPDNLPICNEDLEAQLILDFNRSSTSIKSPLNTQSSDNSIEQYENFQQAESFIFVNNELTKPKKNVKLDLLKRKNRIISYMEQKNQKQKKKTNKTQSYDAACQCSLM